MPEKTVEDSIAADGEIWSYLQILRLSYHLHHTVGLSTDQLAWLADAFNCSPSGIEALLAGAAKKYAELVDASTEMKERVREPKPSGSALHIPIELQRFVYRRANSTRTPPGNRACCKALVLVHQGFSLSEVAKKCGLSLFKVRRICNRVRLSDDRYLTIRNMKEP